MTAVELRDVAYAFPGAKRGSPPVLRGVNLRVASGEAIGIEGANGSGKSTLLRIVATLLSPTAGAVLFDGTPVTASLGAARARIAWCAGAPLGFYPRLDARDNLRFFSGLRGAMLDDAGIDRLLDRVGLGREAAARRYFEYSLGMRQRLHLARLLLEPSSVLVLDEPTQGLDAAGQKLLEELLSVDARGKTRLIVSHDAPFLGRVASRRVRLEGGAIS